MAKSKAFEMNAAKVVDILDAIPPGRCTTYGTIGSTIGIVPRYVALIMASGMPDTSWHRVVAAGGRLAAGAHRPEQRRRLQAEGFAIERDRIVDFKQRFFVP